MHDPLTVAFEMRRPWPHVDAYATRQAARNSVRWRVRRRHHTVIAGRALRWPSLITVWHRDPSGYDSTTCSIYPGRSWRFHIHHWRVQVHPLQRWRRRLLTRCTWCGGRSAKGDTVNVSHSWDGLRARWWQGEKGLFHLDCSSIQKAHSTCVCTQPVLDHNGYGTCARCALFRPFGLTDTNLARVRNLQTVPSGGRRTERGDDD